MKEEVVTSPVNKQTIHTVSSTHIHFVSLSLSRIHIRNTLHSPNYTNNNYPNSKMNNLRSSTIQYQEEEASSNSSSTNSRPATRTSYFPIKKRKKTLEIPPRSSISHTYVRDITLYFFKNLYLSEF